MTIATRKPGIVLAGGDDVPLYRQIYAHFRAAIGAGQLRPGDRLPSARQLAEEFAIARGTVDAAYAMLAGEGYVVSRGAVGTIVSPELDRSPIIKGAAKPSVARNSGEPADRLRPFQMGLPSLDAFPRKKWSQVVARQAQRAVAAFMIEGHFARHVKRMRGLYARRRQALAEALSAVFADNIKLDLKPGGMHLIARFTDSVRDINLARLAQGAGFAVDALSNRAIAHPCGQGLMLGFANLAETDARRLERVIGRQTGVVRTALK